MNSCYERILNPTLIVMAGGFGSRLKSVTGADLPKPMVLVNGRPFLHYQIKSWVSQGIKSYVFLLHFGAKQIIEYLESEKNGILFDCKVSFVVEESPLGTGGAIKNAINVLGLNLPFLVANSDTWIDGGLKKIYGSGPQSIGVVFQDKIDRYGVVSIEDGFVASFASKPKLETSGWINSGLAYLDPVIFLNVKGSIFSLDEKIYPNLCKERKIKSVVLNSNFIDIGIPDDYYFFCNNIKSFVKDNFLI